MPAARRVGEALRREGGRLGLLQVAPTDWTEARREPSRASLSDGEIEELIAARNAARKNRDFARADAVRKQLADAGVILEDRPNGSTRFRR